MRTSIRNALAAAFAIAALSGSAWAQEAAPAAPAPAKAPLTLDTPIAVIVADPAGKAVLDKDVPGLTDHPMYERFKNDSLKQLQPKMAGAIGNDTMATTAKDLAALDASKNR